MELDPSHQQASVKFDNLHDLLFDGAGNPKGGINKKVEFKGTDFDFLEKEGANLSFGAAGSGGGELEKLKISKQFKLANPIPRFQSVPATPQFFDIAGTYLAYPDLKEPLGKYKVKGGFFSKFSLFSRK